MRRLMLTRAIRAHFLRLANFKRSRRSSAVVSLVLVQHLAMTAGHQPKTGLFFLNLSFHRCIQPPSYYTYVTSFMSMCESAIRVNTASFIQVTPGTAKEQREETLSGTGPEWFKLHNHHMTIFILIQQLQNSTSVQLKPQTICVEFRDFCSSPTTEPLEVSHKCKF